jgi:acyl dehydratase
MIEVGQEYKHNFIFSQDEVAAFAKVTGDNNPVHLDADFAATTVFKQPIMHGMLGAAVFSRVFGTLFPGEGTIYLGQNLTFLKPMYVNHTYEAIFEVKEIIADKHRATISTSIKNPEGKLVVIGEALLMNTNVIN